MYRPVQRLNPSRAPSQKRPTSSRIANRTTPLWHRWAALAAFIASLLIVYATVLRPWRIRNTQWQTYRHAETGDWQTAAVFAQRALYWTPRDGSLPWVLLRAEVGNDFSKAGEKALPDLSANQHPQALLAAAELYQAAGDWDRTAEVLPLLAVQLPRDPRVMLLFARQALHEGNIESALDWSLALIESVPEDASTRLLVARLKLMENDLFSSLDATRQLFSAASDPGSDGATALDMLVDLTSRVVLSEDERTRLAQLIHRHPLASTRADLFATAVRLQEFPEDRETIIHETELAHRDTAPVELARWLQQIGEADRSLALLEASGNEADIDPAERAQLQLGAYILLGRESEALDFIARYEDRIGTGESELIRFLLLLRDPSTPPDQLREQAAKALTGTLLLESDRTLLLLARLAASANVPDIAIQAIDAVDIANVSPALAEEAVALKFTYLGMSLDSRGAFEHARQYPQIIRANPTRLNNLVYLGTLLDEDVTEELNLLSRLVKADPRLRLHLDTLAFAEFKQGDFDTAERLLADYPLSIDRAPPATVLLFAQLDYRAGRGEDARRKLESIDPSDLFPEERAACEQLGNNLASLTKSTR